MTVDKPMIATRSPATRRIDFFRCRQPIFGECPMQVHSLKAMRQVRSYRTIDLIQAGR